MGDPRQSEGRILERLHLIRIRGPYEEWLAKTAPDAPLPGLAVARVPHPERPDPGALSKRLAAAAAAARQIEHQSVLHCYGTVEVAPEVVAQLLELHTGLDLEALFGFVRAHRARLPTPLAVWLMRHAAEAVAHAHSLGVVHGSLTPALVALLPEGEVKVDFGLSGGAGAVDDATLTDLVDLRYTRPEWTVSEHPRIREMDVWALGAMLHEALTGEPPQAMIGEAAPTLRLDEVPEPLRAPLADALAPEGDARGAAILAEHLARIFYKTLGAEDEEHGRGPLLDWLGRAGGTDPAVAGALTENADTIYPISPPGQPSEFTQALRAREGPVEPRDFSTDDFGLEPSGPEWETREDPPADATQASPQVHGLTPETMPTTRIVSEPDMEAPKLVAPELPLGAPGTTAPTPTPTPTVPQSRSSVSDVQLRRPSRLTWFLTGFAATLILLVLLRALFAG